MIGLRLLVGMLLLCAITMQAHGAEEMLRNGDFEGEWQPLDSTIDGATAQGQVPDGWQDVSTWSGASTRYTRVPGADGKGSAVRLELLRMDRPNALLQMRSAFDVPMQAGGVYEIRAQLRSSTSTPVELHIRQHEEPRIRFWQTVAPAGPAWREFRFMAEPIDSGSARFFVTLRQRGTVEVDSVSMTRLPDSARQMPAEPIRITGARCVRTRGDLIKHSDIIAMYQEGKAETLRKYRIDIVAWGSQLRTDEKTIAARRGLIRMAHDAGVRMHAVDCAMVQEGGRFVVSQGQRDSPNLPLFWELRKDNERTLARLADLGVDLTRDTVLDVNGDWVPVPWLAKRWRIPTASVYSPAARRWFFEQMDAIGSTGATALHFDEPAMGSYGVRHQSPGDFSDHAMAAFREWLGERPPAVWQEAGVKSLADFNYREFVLAHGGDPRSAPLWREFVRFQLLTTRDLVAELRDRVREKVGRDMPLSMNANASSWIKLPFLALQDFMTTEVPHVAGTCRPPIPPLLVYKLGDAFRQPVASTAHGHDWYLIREDERPLLVCTWLAMSYALGHHLMMPCKAWVMSPIEGSSNYRPTTDHYACMAHFIKSTARLLDHRQTISTVAVVVACDAIERDLSSLNALAARLAAANVPFSVAVEGNDLLERQVTAEDLEGCSAILLASPAFLSDETMERVRKLAGDRPVAEHFGSSLPGFLPRPIKVQGAENVWVLPRAVPGDREAPAVVHLLNRDYDPDARAMRPKGPFTVTLDARLFGGREFKTATMHQPRLLAELPADGDVTTSANVELKQDAEQIELEIPNLELWGVVELS